MKKVFAFVLALCLLCGATALADEYGPNTSAVPKTVLTATLEESYTVVIPTTLNIPLNATSTNLPIEVTALHLLPVGTIDNTVRALQVRVNQPSFMLINDKDSSSYLSYDIGGGTGPLNRIQYFTAKGTKNFVVTTEAKDWDALPAGTYTDSLTFDVYITNISK